MIWINNFHKNKPHPRYGNFSLLSRNLFFICLIQVLCAISFSTSAHTGEDPNQIYPYDLKTMMVNVYSANDPSGISKDIWYCKPDSKCTCISELRTCGPVISASYGRDHCLPVNGVPPNDSNGNRTVWYGVLGSGASWVGHGTSKSGFCGAFDSDWRHYKSGMSFRANRIASCPPNSVLIEGACESKISNKVQKSLGAPDCIFKEGNPCNASTGNKFQAEVDFTTATLSFIRYYNSLLNTNGIVGKNWSHNYSSSLIIATDTVIVRSGSGTGLTFIHPAEGLATSDSNVFSQLFKKTDGSWEYRRTDNTLEIYNTTGQLITIRALNGLETHLSYFSNGSLKDVTDPFGHTLSFSYNTEGKIDTVTTPAQETIQYEYNNGVRLDKVTYPDNTSRQYLYKNNTAAMLNGIVDENDHQYARWDYDSQGRAILSEHID